MIATIFDEPRADVSAHLGLSTTLLLTVIGLLIAFFAVRPELWRRLFFSRLDPRPAGLLRIAFSLVVLWTFLDLLPLARVLFTDEGIFPTDLARRNYGGRLKILWDPEEGFEHWYTAVAAIWSRGSVLHIRSDPAFVYPVYGLTLACITMMMLGIKTRITTVLSWVLVEQLYRYSPIFYTGGDTVTRVFLFVAMFCRWGEAYSLDSWWRRKKAIAGGARSIPPLRRIAAWPLQLMILQLTIIYAATGLLKGGLTWADGTALYYALNLDHFYRVPMTGVVTYLQYIGVLKRLTVAVHFWELLFPLATIGLAINAYERERRASTWISASLIRRVVGWTLIAGIWSILSYIAGLGAYYYLLPQYLPFRTTSTQIQSVITLATATLPIVLIPGYLLLRRHAPGVFDFIRHWLLGKRFWLFAGIAMHVGIDLSMNVGTFAQVMMAVYFAWLSGPEVDALWQLVSTRARPPGEGDRPRRGRVARWLWAPVDRIRFRAPGSRTTVVHSGDEGTVRRVALLRVWDLLERLDFREDAELRSGFRLEVEGQRETLVGGRAGQQLARIFPAFWAVRVVRRIPVLGDAGGRFVLWATR